MDGNNFWAIGFVMVSAVVRRNNGHPFGHTSTPLHHWQDLELLSDNYYICYSSNSGDARFLRTT